MLILKKNKKKSKTDNDNVMVFHIGESTYRNLGPFRVLLYFMIIWSLSSVVFVLFDSDGVPHSASISFEPTKHNESSHFVFYHPLSPEITGGYKLSYCFVQPELNLFVPFSFKAHVKMFSAGVERRNTTIVKELQFFTYKYHSAPFFQETHLYYSPNSYTAFVFSTQMSGLSSVIVFITPLSFLIIANYFLQKIFHTLSILVMMYYLFKLWNASKIIRPYQDKYIFYILITGIFHIDPFQLVSYIGICIPHLVSSLYTSFFEGFLSYYLHIMISERLTSKQFPKISTKLAISFSIAIVLAKFSINFLTSDFTTQLYLISFYTFIFLCSIPMITSIICFKNIPSERNDSNRSNWYLLMQIASIFGIFIGNAFLQLYFHDKLIVQILSVWFTTLGCGWAFMKRTKSEDSCQYMNLYAQEKEYLREKFADKFDFPNDTFDKTTSSLVQKSDYLRQKSQNQKVNRKVFESSSTFT